jgi:hypothetical protein
MYSKRELWEHDNSVDHLRPSQNKKELAKPLVGHSFHGGSNRMSAHEVQTGRTSLSKLPKSSNASNNNEDPQIKLSSYSPPSVTTVGNNQETTSPMYGEDDKTL